MVNVIAESMYEACDDDGNEYMMMDSLLDYRNNNKTATIADKKVVHRGRNYMRQYTVG